MSSRDDRRKSDRTRFRGYVARSAPVDGFAAPAEPGPTNSQSDAPAPPLTRWARVREWVNGLWRRQSSR